MPVKIEPIESNVLRDYVEDAIINSLITGGLKPGDQVIEAEIARQAGISRGPVREAIQLLVGEDILVSIPQRGTFVKQWTEQDLLEIYSIRAILESYAVRLAVERMTDDEMSELTTIIDEMLQFAETGKEADVYEHDLAFHNRAIELSKHRLLCNLLGRLRRQISIFIRFDTETTPDLRQYASNHLLLLNAMKSGDSRKVERVFREHILEVGEMLAKRYQESHPQTS